jgi:Mce-associated membrane protein
MRRNDVTNEVMNDAADAAENDTTDVVARATDDSTRDEPAGGEPAAGTTKPAGRDLPAPRSRSHWMWVSAALLVALVGTGVFGYLEYQAANGEVASLRSAEADRTTAAQMAKDYALKSLSYSFEDPDGFFRSVEDGVSQPLKDKYVNASDLLKGIMTQAQVTSSGEVLATEATPQPNGVYQVVVSASQTVRNVQNPEPRMSIILLQVTVNKVGDTWQISDIGPKTGSQPPTTTPLPGTKPAPGAVTPAPRP